MTPQLGRLSTAAVGVGALLGGGIFFLPKRVENLAGPTTPVAFLLAAGAAISLALGFAVVASSPLGGRSGGVYLTVSRVWESRLAGFLVGWLSLGAYVGLVALLASGLGNILATATPLGPQSATLVVLLGVLGVHLVPRLAGTLQLVLTGGLVVALVGLLVPSLFAIVPGNFDPLLPTPALRDDPVGAVWRATLAATLGFLGMEAVTSVADTARDPERTLPRALLTSVAVVGLVTTLGALVVLGTIPWSRLVFAPVPLLDAFEAALGVSVTPFLGGGVTVATAGAVLALVWIPSRLFAGMGDVVPPLAHTNRFGAPDVAVAVVLGGAAALVVADVVEYALFLAPAGLVTVYLVHALTVAALPFVRPALYETCALRPRPAVLVAASVVWSGVLVGVGHVTLQADPIATLWATRHSPALDALSLGRLVQDPLRSVVPALVGWLTAGVALAVVARDYRLSAGLDAEPLDAVWRAEDRQVDEEGDERDEDGDESEAQPDPTA